MISDALDSFFELLSSAPAAELGPSQSSTARRTHQREEGPHLVADSAKPAQPQERKLDTNSARPTTTSVAVVASTSASTSTTTTTTATARRFMKFGKSVTASSSSSATPTVPTAATSTPSVVVAPTVGPSTSMMMAQDYHRGAAVVASSPMPASPTPSSSSSPASAAYATASSSVWPQQQQQQQHYHHRHSDGTTPASFLMSSLRDALAKSLHLDATQGWFGATIAANANATTTSSAAGNVTTTASGVSSCPPKQELPDLDLQYAALEARLLSLTHQHHHDDRRVVVPSPPVGPVRPVGVVAHHHDQTKQQTSIPPAMMLTTPSMSRSFSDGSMKSTARSGSSDIVGGTAGVGSMGTPGGGGAGATTITNIEVLVRSLMEHTAFTPSQLFDVLLGHFSQNHHHDDEDADEDDDGPQTARIPKTMRVCDALLALVWENMVGRAEDRTTSALVNDDSLDLPRRRQRATSTSPAGDDDADVDDDDDGVSRAQRTPSERSSRLCRFYHNLFTSDPLYCSYSRFPTNTDCCVFRSDILSMLVKCGGSAPLRLVTEFLIHVAHCRECRQLAVTTTLAVTVPTTTSCEQIYHEHEQQEICVGALVLQAVEGVLRERATPTSASCAPKEDTMLLESALLVPLRIQQQQQEASQRSLVCVNHKKKKKKKSWWALLTNVVKQSGQLRFCSDCYGSATAADAPPPPPPPPSSKKESPKSQWSSNAVLDDLVIAVEHLAAAQRIAEYSRQDPAVAVTTSTGDDHDAKNKDVPLVVRPVAVHSQIEACCIAAMKHIEVLSHSQRNDLATSDDGVRKLLSYTPFDIDAPLSSSSSSSSSAAATFSGRGHQHHTTAVEEHCCELLSLLNRKSGEEASSQVSLNMDHPRRIMALLQRLMKHLSGSSVASAPTSRDAAPSSSSPSLHLHPLPQRLASLLIDVAAELLLVIPHYGGNTGGGGASSSSERLLLARAVTPSELTDVLGNSAASTKDTHENMSPVSLYRLALRMAMDLIVEVDRVVVVLQHHHHRTAATESARLMKETEKRRLLLAASVAKVRTAFAKTARTNCTLAMSVLRDALHEAQLSQQQSSLSESSCFYTMLHRMIGTAADAVVARAALQEDSASSGVSALGDTTVSSTPYLISFDGKQFVDCLFACNSRSRSGGSGATGRGGLMGNNNASVVGVFVTEEEQDDHSYNAITGVSSSASRGGVPRTDSTAATSSSSSLAYLMLLGRHSTDLSLPYSSSSQFQFLQDATRITKWARTCILALGRGSVSADSADAFGESSSDFLRKNIGLRQQLILEYLEGVMLLPNTDNNDNTIMMARWLDSERQLFVCQLLKELLCPTVAVSPAATLRVDGRGSADLRRSVSTPMGIMLQCCSVATDALGRLVLRCIEYGRFFLSSPSHAGNNNDSSRNRGQREQVCVMFVKCIVEELSRDLSAELAQKLQRLVAGAGVVAGDVQNEVS